MTDEVRDKYLKVVNIICEQFGLNKPNQIIYVCEAVENLIEPYMKENARLSNSVTELTNSKTELENKVTELEKQIKKIKNCKNLNLKHSKCDKRLKIAVNVKTDDYKFIGKTSPMDYIPLNSFYTERHDSLKKQIKKMKSENNSCPDVMCEDCNKECELKKILGEIKMTKETEGLFEYCKAAVRIATKDVNSGLTHFQVSEEKVIKELEELEAKLKEMEVYLTKGGIILDRNGKQCHVGDKIRWESVGCKFDGKLFFDPKMNQILVITSSQAAYIPTRESIELIEE